MINGSRNDGVRKMDKFCEDCIHNSVCQYGAFPPHKDWCSDKDTLDDLRSQDRWIPVSERLPIRNGVYNVTRIIEGTAISDACYFDGQNTWHRDVCVNHGRPYLTDIMAWQELPEPYEEVVQNDCGD